MGTLLFLMYAFGMKYQDPPEEYGVAIRFGTEEAVSDFSLADKKKAFNSKETPSSVENKTLPKASEPIRDEKLVASEDKEAPVLAKNSSETPKPAKEIQKALENLMKGDASTLEGSQKVQENEKAGQKGKANGTSETSKYYGDDGSDGDENYNLSGRKALTKPIVKPNCNEEGIVVVQIEVNKTGDVVRAVPGVKGTTNTAPCLLQPAEQAALKTKWNTDPKAPVKQVGVIIYKFSLSK